jgi:hypothetical protein
MIFSKVIVHKPAKVSELVKLGYVRKYYASHSTSINIELMLLVSSLLLNNVLSLVRLSPFGDNF